MRPRFALIPMLLWASLASATEPATTTNHKDLDRLQGLWTAKAGPNRNLSVALWIEGSRASVTITMPQGLEIEAQGEIQVNESAQPKALDWVNFTASDEQKLPDVLAIYELRGDTLRVCNGGPNNDRPRQFKPGDGVLADLVTFERAAPPKHQAAAARPSSPDAE